MKRGLAVLVVLVGAALSASLVSAQTPTPTPIPPTPGFEQQGFLPVGSIAMWSTDTAPDGWLFLDGSCAVTDDYPYLFAVIGFITGEPVCTIGEFRLPDMRSRVPIGVGDGTGSGLTNRILWGEGGSETHQLTEAELAAHSHLVTGNFLRNATGSVGFANTGGSWLFVNPQVSTCANCVSQPFTVMNPYLPVNFIIWSGSVPLDLPSASCDDCGGSMLPDGMTGIDPFNFHNMFVPLAFVVGGFLVAFKLQWQAFFYFLAVAYAVQDINQFTFVTICLVAQVLYSKFARSAGGSL